MRPETPGLITLDLFSGCGGLSLGMRRAGFSVAAAVELDPVAAATYKVNHPNTELLVKNIKDVDAAAFKTILKGRRPDLLMGCAPCQGFCTLTRKHHREDPRNLLLLEMARVVEETRPEAIFMENVPGLLSDGAGVFETFVEKLVRLGYFPTWSIVQMADYGVPQNRRRVALLAGHGFVIPLPAPTHSKLGGGPLPVWRTVRKTIGGRTPPIRLDQAHRLGGPQSASWHVVRTLQEQTRARLKAALPGKTWLGVDESVRPECHRGGYEGFTNVYGRMSWDQVSPTITGGCTTPAKGRFGHPDRRRTTISVREAALLQTFPASYRFKTDHMDAVCEMIGNAVPPLFAQKVAEQIKTSLEAHRAALRRAPRGSKAAAAALR
jgi:DNA (cytosine-5)-methyltransferase 1